jgi:threonine dehydrogenase-like Zn-dependent dehydrogenase
MTLDAALDRLKTTLFLSTDRAHALRQAIYCCRKGGTLSVPGVYIGFPDKIPFGAIMNKGLTVKTGQTHVMKYLQPLVERIQKKEIDPRFVITHQLPLDQAPYAYEIFQKKQDGCVKVVLKP